MKKRVVSFLTCVAIIGGLFGNQFSIYADDNIITNTTGAEMVESATSLGEESFHSDALSNGSVGEPALNETAHADESSNEGNGVIPDDNVSTGGASESAEASSGIEETPNAPSVLGDDMGLDIEVTEENLEDVEAVLTLDPEKPKEESTEKYTSYINLADETDTFFGGEIITIYNGIAISGNTATVPDGSYSLIYLPKDSFEKPAMKDISLSFERIKEAEISENDTDYIIKTVYRDLYGGYNGATPVKVSLKRGLTKNQSRHQITQEYYTNDDQLKSESQLTVNGKASLETGESYYASAQRMISEVNENFVIKENTFITFGVNYLRFPNSNERDPRDRRIYATIPEGTRVKENTGWTYDEKLKKWYKDVPANQLTDRQASIILDLGGIDLSEHDSSGKAKTFQVDFSVQLIENGELQTDLGPYTWLSRKSFYILKVEVSTSAYMSISTARKLLYMNKDYGLYQQGMKWNSISTISIPFDKAQLENIRMFIDQQVISHYSISNGKGDEDTRKLIITSASTDVPLYSYPSQIRLNIIGDEDAVTFIRSKIQGTKAYGIKFDGTKELITDQVPIVATDLDGSVNDDNWCKFGENQYKTVVFEFPDGGIELIGENEIQKFSKVLHTNVVADLRERLIDDLKTKMDNNQEPTITARGSNMAGYPSYDDYSRVYVKEVFKETDDAEGPTEKTASATSDTDTYYTLQYETIARNTSINVTNGKTFFVEDTLTTEVSYRHNRNGKASDATTPENLNIYYLVPDGLEPIENKDVFDSMELIRGYKDGYNLIVVRPKQMQIPNLIPNDSAINRTVSNQYSLDFKATKRLDIGQYRIYAGLCLDNNQVDIRNGRQYGILQLDSPSGLFSTITKDAKNRPEVNTKFTDLGSANFTIYPPQSLVALKDIKMANEADGKYSSSVGSKATIGDRIDYRLRLKNNSTAEIRTLTVIDILPFDGDKAIVENQDGRYLSRGSKFRTPLISVEAQDKFDIYYTTDPVRDTIEENKKANWQRQVDDMSKVTMFKAVLKTGQAIQVNEVFDIITHNVIAEDQEIKDREKAFNSFALSLNHEATFIETIKTEVEVNYAKQDVTIEKVDAKDTSIKLEGVTFDLYSTQSDELLLTGLTTNRNGIVVIPDLLVGKSYYLKETSTAAEYTLSEEKIPFTVSEQAENNKIVVKNTKDLLSIPVEKKWIPEAAGSIKVILMADGVAKETVTLTEDNQWKYTFEELPKYDAGTKQPIQYTVSEEGMEADGTIQIGEKTYIVSISGDMQTGYVITNAEKENKEGKPKEERTSVSVTKQWVGKAEKSVKINLMADGQAKDAITLTEENQWKHTFVDLPKYDTATGQLIQYTVLEEGTDTNDEIKIGENTYKVAIGGDMQTGYLVVNTEKPKENGGNPGSPRKDHTGHLVVMKKVIDEKQNLQKAFTFTVTLSDETITGTFGGMVFEKGVATFTLKHGEEKTALHLPKEISYKVEEKDNAGYEVTSSNAVGTVPEEDTVIVSFINKAIKQDEPSVPSRHRNEKPRKPEKPDNDVPPTEGTPSEGNDIPKHEDSEKVEPFDNGTPSNAKENDPGSNQPVRDKDHFKLDQIPRTEDTSSMNVWIFTAVISFLSLAVFILTRKRKN